MKKGIKNADDSIMSKKTAYTEDIEEEDRSNSLENTNDILIGNINEFILNKSLVRKTKTKNYHRKKPSTKAFNLKPFFSSENFDELNIEKWMKNIIKISYDEKNPKKRIFRLFSDEKNRHHFPMLTCRKEKGIYVIRNNMGIAAKIRWNILSNHFKVFDEKNNLIEEIIYNFNFKGMNGPTKLKILLPKSSVKTKSLAKNKNKKLFDKIENKVPEYNEYFKLYVLKFNQRKIIPNERNIQLIYSEYKEDSENILLQFGQSAQNEYILDFKHPFNILVSFAFAITSLSSRTFCK